MVSRLQGVRRSSPRDKDILKEMILKEIILKEIILKEIILFEISRQNTSCKNICYCSHRSVHWLHRP